MSNSSSNATPSGLDHPLAASGNNFAVARPPPPPPPPPPPHQHQSEPRPAPASAPVRAPPGPGRIPSGGSNKPLDGLADEFLSAPSYRTDVLGLEPILRPMPLPKEEGVARLRTLVERRAWGDVLKMATTLLNSSSSDHAAVYATLVTLPLSAQAAVGEKASTVPLPAKLETVEIMILQCHAWLKLRRYNDLSAEIERWNFLVQNDAAATSPPWLPWSVHILAAQTQEYTHNFQQSSTDMLYNLRERIADSKDQNDADDHDLVNMWLICVDNALANIYVRRQQWRQALASWDRCLQILPEAVKSEITNRSRLSETSVDFDATTTNSFQAIYKCELLSRQGRVLLQAGAVEQAGQIFDDVQKIWLDELEPVMTTLPDLLKNDSLLRIMPSMIKSNDGMLSFATSSYDSSLQSFSDAVDLLRKLDTVHPKYRKDDWVGPSIATGMEPSLLYSESVGNMALCHLYECRMKDAVVLLEGIIREDPTAFLTERIAFNLCTLYELGSDSTVGTRKKRILQLIAKRFFLHDVGPESFRIN